MTWAEDVLPQYRLLMESALRLGLEMEIDRLACIIDELEAQAALAEERRSTQ